MTFIKSEYQQHQEDIKGLPKEALEYLNSRNELINKLVASPKWDANFKQTKTYVTKEISPKNNPTEMYRAQCELLQKDLHEVVTM